MPFVKQQRFPLFEKLKKRGYDAVEIPLFGDDMTHYTKVERAFKDNGLGCTADTVIPDKAHSPRKSATVACLTSAWYPSFRDIWYDLRRRGGCHMVWAPLPSALVETGDE